MSENISNVLFIWGPQKLLEKIRQEVFDKNGTLDLNTVCSIPGLETILTGGYGNREDWLMDNWGVLENCFDGSVCIRHDRDDSETGFSDNLSADFFTKGVLCIEFFIAFSEKYPECRIQFEALDRPTGNITLGSYQGGGMVSTDDDVDFGFDFETDFESDFIMPEASV